MLNVQVFLIFLFYIYDILSTIKFTVQNYIYPSVSKVRAGSFHVCHPPKSDIDYMIFNVRT